jgi:hypothetical protein
MSFGNVSKYLPLVKICTGAALANDFPTDLFATAGGPSALVYGQVSAHLDLPYDAAIAFVDATAPCETATQYVTFPGTGLNPGDSGTIFVVSYASNNNIVGPFEDDTTPDVNANALLRFGNLTVIDALSPATIGGTNAGTYGDFISGASELMLAHAVPPLYDLDLFDYAAIAPQVTTLSIGPASGPTFSLTSPTTLVSAGIQSAWLLGDDTSSLNLLFCDDASGVGGLENCSVSPLVANKLQRPAAPGSRRGPPARLSAAPGSLAAAPPLSGVPTRPGERAPRARSRVWPSRSPPAPGGRPSPRGSPPWRLASPPRPRAPLVFAPPTLHRSP